MQPYQAKIFIYADNENEVKEFEQIFYDFVNGKREQGIAVKAKKLTEALAKFHNNYFVNQFLK